VSKQYSAPHPMQIDASRSYAATVKTNKGDITVRLYADGAPNTVNNFVALARDGYYDGVIFHRVIQGFMLQGGDPSGTGHGDRGRYPGYTFADELDLARKHRYPLGTLAMANAGPNTNGSQFFIMHADYGLPPQYTVFGKTIDGLDIVDEIGNVATGAGDRPTEDVIITTIEITEADA